MQPEKAPNVFEDEAPTTKRPKLPEGMEASDDVLDELSGLELDVDGLEADATEVGPAPLFKRG
jgi:hypothetical protein